MKPGLKSESFKVELKEEYFGRYWVEQEAIVKGEVSKSLGVYSYYLEFKKIGLWRRIKNFCYKIFFKNKMDS